MNEVNAMSSVETSRALRRKRNRETIRWYVLLLPVSSAPFAASSPAVRLQAELERREKNGEPRFDYFAPTCVTRYALHGKLLARPRPLFYNYVFIHASENEIFRLKRVLPVFNFLPRVYTEDDYYYPYVSDSEMENLRWIASSYSNELPLYELDGQQLVHGDRVRITAGILKGLEAEVVRRSGTRQKDVIVRVLDNVLVSLYTVRPGEYEVISLSQKGKHQYAHLSNERYFNGLHEALFRHYTSSGVTQSDCDLAAEVIQSCAQLELDSDILRSKAYSLLLLAYKVLDRHEEFSRLMGTVLNLLPLIKAQQSVALLLVTMYGCTNNRKFYDQSHGIVGTWHKEEISKKNKRVLVSRLADYDRWFGHA